MSGMLAGSGKHAEVVDKAYADGGGCGGEGKTGEERKKRENLIEEKKKRRRWGRCS